LVNESKENARLIDSMVKGTGEGYIGAPMDETILFPCWECCLESII
jgi:hypothetical protein